VTRKRNHRHPEEERRTSVIRVRKIVGQLNAVQRMIDEDRQLL
jgi:DNA-binding FrmR family transcriptional regulator